MPETKAVTCKVRLLDTIPETVDLLRMIERTGVAAVGIHARRVPDRPRFKARWEELSQTLSAASLSYPRDRQRRHLRARRHSAAERSDIRMFLGDDRSWCVEERVDIQKGRDAADRRRHDGLHQARATVRSTLPEREVRLSTDDKTRAECTARRPHQHRQVLHRLDDWYSHLSRETQKGRQQYVIVITPE